MKGSLKEGDKTTLILYLIDHERSTTQARISRFRLMRGASLCHAQAMLSPWKVCVCLIASFGLFSSVHAFDNYYLLKVTGHDGEQSYQVLSQDELKTFEKALRTESFVFRKAFSLAKDEWQSDEQTQRVPFPTMRPRRFSKAGTYDSREAANEKVAQYLAPDENDKNKKKGPKVDKDKAAKQKEQDAERARMDAAAQGLLLKHMAALISERGEEPMLQSAPSTTHKSNVKGGKGGEVEATVTGTLKKAHKSFYVAANEGQLVAGLKPWGIDLPKEYSKEELVGKEVTIHFKATGTPRGDQIKVTGVQILDFKVAGGEGGAEAAPEKKAEPKAAH
jgi:hypothetical protein